MKPHEVTADIVREFIYYMKNDHVKFKNNSHIKNHYKTLGVSAVTINSTLRIIRSMFNFWVEENYLDENPFNKVKLLRESKDTVSALTLQQVSRLLKEPDKRSFAGFRDYVLMTLLVDSGLRIGEVINLKYSHIDFRTNIIEINAEIAKNRKTRYVPFSRKTSRLLRELKAEVEELSSPYVFVTVYGNQLDRSRVRTRMKKYGELAGITGVRLSPHVLRHTFAKFYLLNNGD